MLALKERRDADRAGSTDIVKELRKEQTKVIAKFMCVRHVRHITCASHLQLRSMDIERGVESIIRERSLKVRYFACLIE